MSTVKKKRKNAATKKVAKVKSRPAKKRAVVVVPYIKEDPAYAYGKVALPGESVVMDHPDDKQTKIVVTTEAVTNENGTENPDSKMEIVLQPVAMRSLAFDQWPEEVQRGEYELFMQKVRTYREFWPGNIGWPTFSDFQDNDVRDSAYEELNKYIDLANTKQANNMWPSPDNAMVSKERRRLDKIESVNHPAHYGGDTTYEVIKVLEEWNITDFCIGNTIKLLARMGKKTEGTNADLIELRKAAWYLNRKIQQKEKENAENTLLNISEKQTG